MSAQQPIMTSIQNLLANNTTVTATVATRIYDSLAPQDAALPMLVLSVVTDVPKIYFTLEDLGPLQMQVDVYGKVEGGSAAVRTLGDTVYAALHRAQPTASGYSGVSVLCTDRGDHMDQEMVVGGRSQQDAWRVMQQYNIFGTGTS